TPLGKILPGKHVPVAFEQRPALRFGQALQAAEVVRVVLEQVGVVLNPGRNESVPDSRLVLPNDVPQALVHEHFLDPKVADVTGVACGPGPRPRTGDRGAKTGAHPGRPHVLCDVGELVKADEAVLSRLVLVTVGLSLTVPKLQHRTVLEVPRLLAGPPLANASWELLQTPLDQRPIQLRERAAQKQSLVAGSLHALDEGLP